MSASKAVPRRIAPDFEAMVREIHKTFHDEGPGLVTDTFVESQLRCCYADGLERGARVADQSWQEWEDSRVKAKARTINLKILTEAEKAREPKVY